MLKMSHFSTPEKTVDIFILNAEVGLRNPWPSRDDAPAKMATYQFLRMRTVTCSIQSLYLEPLCHLERLNDRYPKRQAYGLRGALPGRARGGWRKYYLLKNSSQLLIDEASNTGTHAYSYRKYICHGFKYLTCYASNL